MRKGITNLYGFMLENLANKDTNISLKDLKYICELAYDWIKFSKEDVEVIISEYKKISPKNIK